MGLSSSSDCFLQAINCILEPCQAWLRQEVDDLLITDSSLEELNAHLREVLTLCSQNGVQLSRSKVECGTKLVFAGMLLDATPDGLEVTPDPSRIRAICEYPAPMDLESL